MTLRSGFLDKILEDRRQLVVFLSLLCVGVFIAQCIGAWYRLRHFKGPFLASFSNVWLMRAVTSGRMHLDYWEANQKYGTLCRATRGSYVMALV
jgi:hypothetical protein